MGVAEGEVCEKWDGGEYGAEQHALTDLPVDPEILTPATGMTNT